MKYGCLPSAWLSTASRFRCAAEIINSLQGLVSRESTYNVPAVLTVTGITAGNGAYNIIPNSATIVGGLRTQSLEVRSHLLKRMNAECGACEDKKRIATRAKQLNLDAIHDTVHEMAKDEARHGKGFEGLYNRYFKK